MSQGDVRFVPREYLTQVLHADAPLEDRVAAFAQLSRINALGMIMTAGSGHIGSSFSSAEIMAWVLIGELGEGVGPLQPGRFYSSKGHDAPGLYAIQIGLGNIDEGNLTRLRRLDGLPGHPDVSIPAMVTNTGSLGMGISKAKGFAVADRLDSREAVTYVLLGDGELQEGQNWESLPGAVNHGHSAIVAIVDANRLQSDTWVEDVSDLGDVEARFAASGWATASVDGHDVVALRDAIARLRADDRPGVIVAHTVKGKGVTAMEEFGRDDDLYAFHSGAPAWPVYHASVEELAERAQALASDLGLGPIPFVSSPVDRVPPKSTATLVGAWAAALGDLAADERVVVLDADLRKDLGLVAFAAQHPDRFIECGIAEQDMVSQAGALALSGYLPIACSFACFLTTRPFEQIINNASEETHVLYVGALAGLIPAGPGHSHQAVTDVASMATVLGMVVAEPFHPAQVGPIVEHLAHGHDGPAYLRLCSVPLPFDEIPDPPATPVGVGTTLREGSDLTVLVTSAPLVLEALRAAEALAGEGVSARVVATSWLNRIDPAWLASAVLPGRPLLVIENHNPAGAFGAAVATALLAQGLSVPWAHLAVEGKQACGTNAEALAFHGLDAASIADRARRLGADAARA
jgi:transketolase